MGHVEQCPLILLNFEPLILDQSQRTLNLEKPKTSLPFGRNLKHLYPLVEVNIFTVLKINLN